MVNFLKNVSYNFLNNYRDFYSFYRKVLIIIVAQILPLEDDSKALLFLMIIGLSFYFHSIKLPFSNDKINICETHIHLLILFTFYWGFLYYFLPSLIMEYMFTIFFYFFNIMFLVYWIYKIWVKDSFKKLQRIEFN